MKVVTAANGDALYFSRSRIPFDREGGDGEFWAHRPVCIPHGGAGTVRQPAAVSAGKAGKTGAAALLENGVPIRVVRVEGYEATAWTRRKIWKPSANCSRSTPAKAASINTGAYATLTNATAGLPPRFNITETE